MLFFHSVNNSHLNLKMVGKPSGKSPTNCHLAFLLLSALDFSLSLFLEKKEKQFLGCRSDNRSPKLALPSVTDPRNLAVIVLDYPGIPVSISKC